MRASRRPTHSRDACAFGACNPTARGVRRSNVQRSIFNVHTSQESAQAVSHKLLAGSIYSAFQ